MEDSLHDAGWYHGRKRAMLKLASHVVKPKLFTHAISKPGLGSPSYQCKTTERMLLLVSS